MPGDKAKVNREILKAAKQQKETRETSNLDETQESYFVDASRNIAVSIGSKDLRYSWSDLKIVNNFILF